MRTPSRSQWTPSEPTSSARRAYHPWTLHGHRYSHHCHDAGTGPNHYVEQKIANLGTNIFRVGRLPFAVTDFALLTHAQRHKFLIPTTWKPSPQDAHIAIGVMHIMPITVTGCTGEIGTRKAIGARKSDIRVQFLMEAVMLSGIGGALGILMGGGSSMAARVLASIPASVSLFWVVMGVAISVGVGLFSDTIPPIARPILILSCA